MKRKKQLMLAFLSMAMAVSLPAAGYGATSPMVGQSSWEETEEAGTGPSLEQEARAVGAKEEEIPRELLEDNRLEYREIGARIENYNKDYRNAVTQLSSGYLNLDAARDLAAEASELMEEAKDLKDDDMDAETRALYESYKSAVRAIRKEAQSMTGEELPSSAQRTLRRAKRNLTKVVENLLISYEILESQAAAAKKNVELSQAMVQSKELMASQGMCSAADVLSAQETLYSAQNGAAQLNAGLFNLQQNILILLGWDYGSPVEFAAIGEPDLSRLDSMNLEQDTQAAISANYELFDIRSSGASGSAGRAVKKRSVSVTSQTVAIQMEKLYGEVMAKKQAYDAAVSDFAAASQTMEAADRKKALGMTGNLEYLGNQASYLGAKASYTAASLGLFKAMEDYDWAVSGLIVSDGG